MGKRRTLGQSSESIITVNSDLFSLDSNGEDTICQHSNKSVDLNLVRKGIISKGGFSALHCVRCDDPSDNYVLHLCLKCAFFGCQNHIVHHINTPHSDPHLIVLQLDTVWIVRCYKCNENIPPESNKKLKNCLTSLKDLRDKVQSKPLPVKGKTDNHVNELADKMASGFNFKLNNQVDAHLVPTTSSPVRGLRNLGNTCFFNSVLQCLAQTPFLLEVLTEISEPGEKVVINVDQEHQLVAELDKWGPLTETVAETLKEMTNGSSGIYSPNMLLDALRRKCRQFIGYNQHDSHELLRQLLDSVKTEDIRRYQYHILEYYGLSKKSAPDEVDEKKRALVKHLNQKLTELVVIRPDQVFKGTLVSTVQCMKCGHTSEVIESFLDLSLPVLFEKHQSSCSKNKFDFCNKDEPTKSKHQLKKERRLARKARKGANKNKNKTTSNNSAIYRNKENNIFNEAAANTTTITSTNNNCVVNSCAHKKSVYDFTNATNVSNEGSGMLSVDDEENEALLRSTLNELKSNQSSTSIGDDRNDTNNDAAEIDTMCTENGTHNNNTNNHNHNSDNGNSGIFVEDEEMADNDNSAAQKTTKSSSSNHRSGGLSLPTLSKPSTASSFNDENPPSPITDDIDSAIPTPPPLQYYNPVGGKSVIAVPYYKMGAESDDNSSCCSGGANSQQDDDNDDEDEEEDGNSSDADGEDENDNNDDVGDEDDDYLSISRQNRITLAPRTSYSHLESSIHACLSQFTDLEILSNNNKVLCEACTERQNKNLQENEKKKPVYQPATKRLLINSPPPVLILHLKRFQGSMFAALRKIFDHISFPLHLDIAQYCSAKCQNLKTPNQSKIMYSLYGVVEHSGGLYGGHYVAYVKVRPPVSGNNYRRSFLSGNSVAANGSPIRPDDVEAELNKKGTWYHISDSSVSPTSEETVLRSQAYLLFYERIV